MGHGRIRPISRRGHGHGELGVGFGTTANNFAGTGPAPSNITSVSRVDPRVNTANNAAGTATFSNDRPANEHPANVGGDIRLARFNVENYFPMTGEEYEARGLGTCTYDVDRDGNNIGRAAMRR